MRIRPPNRRHCETITIDALGGHYHVSVGYYPDGRVCEVFCHGAKVGSDQDHLIDDVGVVLSVMLQSGIDLASMSESLGWLPGGEPASIIGHLLRVIEECAEPTVCLRMVG